MAGGKTERPAPDPTKGSLPEKITSYMNYIFGA